MKLSIGMPVLAVRQITDLQRDQEGNQCEVEAAAVGDRGEIVSMEAGCYPTVYWHRTRQVCDSIPTEEFLSEAKETPLPWEHFKTSMRAN